MARLVALPQLVREAALRVPGEQARVVVRHFLEGGIAEVAALGVVPDRLLRIGRVGDRLLGLHHPLGDGAEVQHGGVALGRLQEVDGHGVDEREVPRRLAVLGRLQLRHSQARIGQPGHVADVVGLEVLERLEGVVVDRRSPAQRRVHHHLQGRRGLRHAHDLAPVGRHLRRLVLGRGRPEQRRADQHERDPHAADGCGSWSPPVPRRLAPRRERRQWTQ